MTQSTIIDLRHIIFLCITQSFERNNHGSLVVDYFYCTPLTYDVNGTREAVHKNRMLISLHSGKFMYLVSEHIEPSSFTSANF